MSNGKELAPVVPASTALTKPHLTIGELVNNVMMIQEAMEAVMKDGHHYGRIPGTPKPTLYQPGAEKLLQLFRLSSEQQIEDLSTADRRAYRVHTLLTHIPSGEFVCDGWGSASTDEERYRWRKAVNEAEWDATAAGQRRIKYRRRKTRGKDEYTDIEEHQVRTQPLDLDNTVLKMACKRALVHATRTGTAASDVFAQDIEDLPEHLRQQASEDAPIQQPQATQPEATGAPVSTQDAVATTASQPEPGPATGPPGAPPPPESAPPPPAEPAPEPEAEAVPEQLREIGQVQATSSKAGGNSANPWTRYGVKVNDQWHNTFDHKLGKAAEDLKRSQMVAVVVYHITQYGRDLDEIYSEVEEGANDAPPWE